MVKRWLIYIKESFIPLMRLILCLIICFAIFSLLRGYYGPALKFSWLTTIIGTVNCFLFLLYVRVTDEFKDFEVDAKYFPERPVPSGKIALKDLTILKFIIVGLLILINVVYSWAIWEFLITLALFYLMSKWFFLEKTISNNRILAFLTHSPVYLFLFNYICALYLIPNHITSFSPVRIAVVFWIWLPMVAWEIIRKTYAPQDEHPGYQTYSQMLGYRAATVIGAGFIIIQNILLFAFQTSWRISPVILILFLICVSVFFWQSWRFIRKPVSGNHYLTLTSEIYQLLSFLFVSINLLLSR